MEMTVNGSSNLLSMKTNSGGWGVAVLLNICELCGGLCHFKSRLFCFLQYEWNSSFSSSSVGATACCWLWPVEQ